MKHSLRKAINDMCKSCIYDEFDKGNWRQQVTACTMPKCALYPVRPLTKPHTERSAVKPPQMETNNES